MSEPLRVRRLLMEATVPAPIWVPEVVLSVIREALDSRASVQITLNLHDGAIKSLDIRQHVAVNT